MWEEKVVRVGPTLVTCPSCGKRISVNAKYCLGCGDPDAVGKNRAKNG